MDKKFLESYFDAYNSEDAERLGGFYTPEVVLCYDNNTHMGKTAVLETYSYIQNLFEDRMILHSVFVQGSSAVVELENRFVAKKDIANFLGRDLKAGESFVMPLVGEYTFSGGKISNVNITKK